MTEASLGEPLGLLEIAMLYKYITYPKPWSSYLGPYLKYGGRGFLRLSSVHSSGCFEASGEGLGVYGLGFRGSFGISSRFLCGWGRVLSCDYRLRANVTLSVCCYEGSRALRSTCRSPLALGHWVLGSVRLVCSEFR